MFTNSRGYFPSSSLFFLLSVLARTGRQVQRLLLQIFPHPPFHWGCDLLRPSTSLRKGSLQSSPPLILVWAPYRGSTDFYVCLCFPPCVLFSPLSFREFSCWGGNSVIDFKLHICEHVSASLTKGGFSKCPVYHTPQRQQPLIYFLSIFLLFILIQLFLEIYTQLYYVKCLLCLWLCRNNST